VRRSFHQCYSGLTGGFHANWRAISIVMLMLDFAKPEDRMA
jgi:hypothetical protein